jgi:hypothetical protein
VGEVRLLQAMKVPPGYRKIIRGQLHGAIRGALMLFTPTLDNPAVQMAKGIVDGREGCSTSSRTIVQTSSTSGGVKCWGQLCRPRRWIPVGTPTQQD